MFRKPVNLTVINSKLPSYLKIVTNGTTQLKGRIQIEDGNTPIWGEENGTLMYLNEDDGYVERVLNASPSPSGTELTFELFPTLEGSGGFLPFGFTLDSKTGKISGTTTQNIINDTSDRITFFDEERPVWNSNSGVLAKIGESESVNITLNAVHADGEGSVHYYVVDGALPYGVELNGTTGVIGGNASEILGAVPISEHIIPNPDPKPRWETLTGAVGIFDEKTNVSVTIKATTALDKKITYSVVNGHLPTGLFLNNKTGEITGNTGEILNKTNIFDEIKFPRLLPVPQWVTPRFVDIVVVKEKEPVDYQLELEYPEVYGALYHRIIAGALPFGLELSKTGRITGAVNEILQTVPYSEHTLATITPKPTWSTATGIVGVFDEKQQATITLQANSETPIVSYNIVGGSLPNGLILSKTGVISGEVGELLFKTDIRNEVNFPALLPKPEWVTLPSTIITTTEKQPISFDLAVSHNAVYGEVNYKIINGHLPFGVELSKVGKLSGTVNEVLQPVPKEEHLLAVITNSPTWNTAEGILDVFNELQPVTLPLSATANNVKYVTVDEITTPVPENLTYYITEGELPFGLLMDKAGNISGTIGENLYEKVITDTISFEIEVNKPVWNVPTGLLKRALEKETVSLSISATSEIESPLVYKIVDGHLPFGVELDKTGNILGTITEIIAPETEDIIDVGAPVIATDSVLGTFELGEEVNLALEYTIYEGRTISGLAIYPNKDAGKLPFGLFLSKSGVISGIVDTQSPIGDYTFTVVITDNVGLKSSKSFTINIVEPEVIEA